MTRRAEPVGVATVDLPPTAQGVASQGPCSWGDLSSKRVRRHESARIKPSATADVRPYRDELKNGVSGMRWKSMPRATQSSERRGVPDVSHGH